MGEKRTPTSFRPLWILFSRAPHKPARSCYNESATVQGTVAHPSENSITWRQQLYTKGRPAHHLKQKHQWEREVNKKPRAISKSQYATLTWGVPNWSSSIDSHAKQKNTRQRPWQNAEWWKCCVGEATENIIIGKIRFRTRRGGEGSLGYIPNKYIWKSPNRKSKFGLNLNLTWGEGGEVFFYLLKESLA